MPLWQLISSIGRKVLKTIPKSISNLLSLKINVLKQDVEITLLLFEIVLKIHAFGKSDKDKSFGEQAKSTNYLIGFLLSDQNCQN